MRPIVVDGSFFRPTSRCSSNASARNRSQVVERALDLAGQPGDQGIEAGPILVHRPLRRQSRHLPG